MARSNVIRLCISLAAIPVLFALGALTIPDAHAQSRKAPRSTPLAPGRAVLTATMPVSVSAALAMEMGLSAEPVRDPSIAVGPDGTAHFAWWSPTNLLWNPCDGPNTPSNPGNAVFYAYIEPSANKPMVSGPVANRSRPRLSVGLDNTLFMAWQKCNTNTMQYHPAFDWAPARSWREIQYLAPFTFTTGYEDVNPLDRLNSQRYVDGTDAPFPFIAQENGQSRLHLIWGRSDTQAPDAAPALYYARPVTDDKPITDPRTPDPRLETTTISIADYAGQSPSMAVFENNGNMEAHVVWQAQVAPDCDMSEIEWGYAPNLPPTLTTAEPGTLPPTWEMARAISMNGESKRAAKGPSSCGSVTRTALHPATATGPDATLYAVWAEWAGENPDYEIMAAHLMRDSAGIFWSEPVTVTMASRSMTLAAATAVDKRGRQYVLWNEGLDKIELKAMDANEKWATTPIQLNRGADCEGTPSASGQKVGDVGLAYDPVQDRLHAIWLARTATANLPNRLCYASVDVKPDVKPTYQVYLPLVSRAATPPVSAAKVSGIRPLARP
ncbi:MAG: hypothetical protein U0768_17185 [Anaerolineae bacterium]